MITTPRRGRLSGDQIRMPGSVLESTGGSILVSAEGVIELLLVGAAEDELWANGIPNRGVLAGLPEPRRVLFANIPAGLVLVPVVGPGEHRAPLVPDD